MDTIPQDDTPRKQCSRRDCKQWFPATPEFFSRDKQTIDGLTNQCKQCRAKKSLERYHSIGYIKPTHRKYGPQSRRSRSRRKLRQYGLTIEEYETMLETQCGVCAICGQPESTCYRGTGKVMSLAVDHDHRTGKVRGLLCRKCNTELGRYEKIKPVFEPYLERYSG